MTGGMPDWRAAWEAHLTRERLLPLQVVQGALTMGVVSFALVLGMLRAGGFGSSAEPTEGGLSTVRMLGGVVLLLSVSAVVASLFAFAAILRAERVAAIVRGEDAGEGAARLLDLVRTAYILRLAILEAPAMLGLVVCLLATMNGALASRPALWLNALPAALLVAFSLATFPTRDRLLFLVRERVEPALLRGGST